MTSQLSSPALETDRIDDRPFPYDDEQTGFALPRPVARGTLRPGDGSDAIGAAGSLECPACSSETTNGAGLFACTECSWTGTLR